MAKGDDDEARRKRRAIPSVTTSTPAPRFSDAERAELARMNLCTACGQRPPLCPRCLEMCHGWHAGTAEARGEWWAERAMRWRHRDPSVLRAWPSYDASPRARQLAARHVSDCASDPALRERLARECYASAAARWLVLITDAAERERVLLSR